MLLLQGATPALVFGVWRPGGTLLVVVAMIYVFLAWGVWASKKWALVLSIIFTVPQLVVISSRLFSWQFYIGGAFGPGIAPSSSLLDTHLASFFSLGARFDFAVSERCPSLLEGYTSIGSETFILLNVVALLVFTILTAILLKSRRKTLAG